MVNSGYKQTEIGILPVEWDVDNLGSRADIYRGGSPRPIQAYLTQSASGLNWIKIGDVKPGEKYITSTQEKIILEGLSKTRQVSVGDFILSNSMSFGRPYILRLDGCIHDGWLTIQNYKGSFDSDYLYYVLSSDAVIKQYISMASGSSVQNLNKEKVAAVLLAVPSKPEQKAISEVLSDIDTLIVNLEKLIAKKKAIKQGAMQELLTGKRRLPGFDGEWVELEIGKNGHLLRESINPQTHPNVMFSEYSMPAFDEGQIPVKKYGADMHSNRTVIYGTVLLFNKLNVRQKRIWLVNATENNAVCSSEFLPYCSETIDLRLLQQLLSTEKVTNDFIGMSTGTSNSQKRITPRNFLDYSVYVPNDINEQAAIADILVDMDSEIAQLQQTLVKYQLVKQGMMSELLTGRIRLV